MVYEGDIERDNETGLSRFLGWFSIGLGMAGVLAPRRLATLIGVSQRPTLIRLLGLRELASGLGIFSQRRPAGAVWSRVAGDAIDLALLGTALGSPKTNKERAGIAAISVLGVTALDMLCARQLNRETRAVRIQSVTVNRPIEEVYGFWRDFQNLPRFMSHLESVRVTGDRRSHWVAKAPAGTRVEWDAEITAERPNELIAWRSLPGADVENSGLIHFQPAPGGRGTEIHVKLEYNPPGGVLGAQIAKLFGEEPGQQLKDDLYRFKQVMETGQVVYSDASIYRARHAAQPPAGDVREIIESEGEQPYGLAA